MLNEYIPNTTCQNIANDIDEKALEKAKLRNYQKQALKEVPAPLKEKYFTDKDDFYSVKPFLKQYITYKKHNLLNDTYPKNVDLIICRYVLIYFIVEVNEIIYNSFY